MSIVPSSLSPPVVFTLPPPPPDGESAWRQVAPAVEAAVRGATSPIITDPQKAAETVIRVAREARADGALYATLKKLAAAGFFDLAVIERLARHAPALWYARHQHLVEELAPGHVVAPSVFEEATALCQRMGKVARHNLEDDAVEGPRAKSVKHAAGRRQLANHLLVAAGLYERNEAAIRNDRHYRAGDAARAKELAAEIQQALGRNGSVRWADRCAVLWTWLKRDYDELRAAGRWLLRARPDEAKARFPSLLEGQGGRRKTEAREEPAAPQPAAPQPAAPPSAATQPAAPPPAATQPAAPQPAAPQPAEAPAAPAAAPPAPAASKPRKALVRKGAAPAATRKAANAR